MDSDRINLAIQDGLAHCRNVDSIIVALAAFLAGLRAAGWSKGDVRAVELGILTVLNSIATVKMSRDGTAVREASKPDLQSRNSVAWRSTSTVTFCTGRAFRANAAPHQARVVRFGSPK